MLHFKSYLKKIILFSVLILLTQQALWAHAVQIAYCVSCNGDLRIYIEHWHGALSSGGVTQMQVDFNINGNYSTQTSPPDGVVNNTTINNLPGCATQIISIAGCPRNMNNENNWFYYDYTGLPQGVPISFTIYASSNVYAADACGMFPVTASFTIPVGVGTTPDQYVCAGSPTQPVSFSNASSWTNNNPSIGLPASGTGTIPSFTPVGPPGTTATISYSNSCASGTFQYVIMDNPTSNFSSSVNGNPTTGTCIGNTFDFTDLTTINSGSITGWNWDFGDGTTSTAQNPSHTYAAPGTYTVTLTTTGSNGCTNTYSSTVTVYDTPVPAFTATPNCPGSGTTFTDGSTVNGGTIVSWNWDFGDGNTSTLQNPSNIYAAAGTYNVTLTVTSDQGCTATITQPVDIPYIPVANFSATEVCEGDITTFTDLSTVTNAGIGNWYWLFGDATSSNVQSPTHTYASSGVYAVTLIVASNHPAQCSDDTTILVYVDTLPVPNFTTNDVCDGYSAVFTNTTAQNPQVTTWNWDFGDGATDTQQNTSHLYAADGSYNVTLTATTYQGCVDSVTLPITVHPLPVPDFSSDTVCAQTPTTFTDLSTINSGSITGWSWDIMNDNSVEYNIQNPQHTFNSGGIYPVQLTLVSDQGCVDSITKNVEVYYLPVVDFTVDSVCLGTPTTFTDQSTIGGGSNVAWDWNFGDGNTGTGNSTTHTYAAYGTYTIQLDVTSDNGCVVSLTKTTEVYEMPQTSFTVTDECIYTPVAPNNTSSINTGTISYLWDFGDGTQYNIPSPAHTYNTPGVYTIILTGTSNNNCTTYDTNIVTVYDKPFADFTIPEVCYGVNSQFTDISFIPTVVNGDSITSWSWDINYDGSQDFNTQNVSYLYANEGGHTAQLIVTTAFGCADTVVKPVTVWPLPVVDFNPTEVCLLEATQFNDLTTISNIYTSNSPMYWSWDFGDGATDNVQNPVHAYNTAGSYNAQLIVTSNHGCIDSANKVVTVNPLPEINLATTNPDSCTTHCITFISNSTIATGSLTGYIWSFGNGDTAYTQTATYCYTNEGLGMDVYDIYFKAISDKGCTSDTTMYNYVHIYPHVYPDFIYMPDSIFISSSMVQFTDLSQIPSIWHWDFGDGDTSNVTSPSHLYADSGNYIVTLAVENQYGCRDTVRKPLRVIPEVFFYVPNAFTPDGDGINDVFAPKGYGIQDRKYSMYIFDRWGEIIYETHDLFEPWDGTNKKGNLVQIDTYVVKIEYLDIFDEPHEYIGHVTIIK